MSAGMDVEIQVDADAIAENCRRVQARRSDLLPAIIVRGKDGSRRVHSLRIAGSLAELRGFAHDLMYSVRLYTFERELEDVPPTEDHP